MPNSGSDDPLSLRHETPYDYAHPEIDVPATAAVSDTRRFTMDRFTRAAKGGAFAAVIVDVALCISDPQYPTYPGEVVWAPAAAMTLWGLIRCATAPTKQQSL